MKRDMDLIRRIALAVAEMPYDEFLQELDGVEPEVFGMHAIWMSEAGLVHGAFDEPMHGGPPTAAIFRLTWAGCEFADAVRDDTLWSKAKKQVLKPSASWTFSLLTEWLKSEIGQGFPTVRGQLEKIT